MGYYNTTSETGEKLKAYISECASQEDAVLKLFQKFKHGTASEVWKFYGVYSAPLTSIRRAITDLTKEGLLVRTEDKREGIYGRPESVYRITKKQSNE